MIVSKKSKDIVREKYGKIARQATNDCCGCSGEVDYSVFNDSYAQQPGYVAEADLGLGCGLPTEYADIKPGDTVVDLGSGAGNDAFVARALVGDKGRVIGVDMTAEMIQKAESNLAKLGYDNVEFRSGDLESLPLDPDSVDVAVSNCVVNLVPDKSQAFAEMYRVLKPGGHFCISDIVIEGELTEALKKSAEAYAGCVSGAMPREEYLSVISEQGFQNVTIHKSKEIVLPEELLKQLLSREEIAEFRDSAIGIFSITVSGEKLS